MIALTGDRPTGRLHLGHYIGSLKNRVVLQETCDQYIMIADLQALTDHFESPRTITDSVLELVADYLAVGIDPMKSTIFVQSQISALSEMTMYFMNLVSISRVERNPTVKAEIAQKGFNDSIPVGFVCYPISQAADITAFKADIVPVGDDQLPMIEQTNEIVRKFNRIYSTNCLKEVKPRLSHVSRLVGIDGQAKAGKSLNNAIFLSDTSEAIKTKVFSMFTDPNHIRVSDPGKVEGNVVFSYLDAFFEDKDELEDLKKQYRKGGLGDTTIKSKLNDTLQSLLQPIREKRAQLSRDFLKEICHEGTKKAQRVASDTLEEIRDAIGLKYGI